MRCNTTALYRSFYLGILIYTDRICICRNSLEVQWLGLHAFTVEILGSIPGQGTRIPQVMWCGKNVCLSTGIRVPCRITGSSAKVHRNHWTAFPEQGCREIFWPLEPQTAKRKCCHSFGLRCACLLLICINFYLCPGLCSLNTNSTICIFIYKLCLHRHQPFLSWKFDWGHLFCWEE